MATASLPVRLGSQVKAQSEQLFQDLGMTSTTAINAFLRRAIQVGGLPFEIKKADPSWEMWQTLLKSQHLLGDLTARGYMGVEQTLAELKKQALKSDGPCGSKRTTRCDVTRATDERAR